MTETLHISDEAEIRARRFPFAALRLRVKPFSVAARGYAGVLGAREGTKARRNLVWECDR